MDHRQSANVQNLLLVPNVPGVVRDDADHVVVRTNGVGVDFSVSIPDKSPNRRIVFYLPPNGHVGTYDVLVLNPDGSTSDLLTGNDGAGPKTMMRNLTVVYDASLEDYATVSATETYVPA